AKVKTMLAVEIPLRALFEAPTVAEFAKLVEQALSRNESMQTPPLVPAPHEDPIPLSFAQQRLWFLDQLEPQSTAYLIANAYRFQGDLQVKVLDAVMQEVISRQEALRTIFEERAGQPIQVIHPIGHLVLPVIDLQGLNASHRESEMRCLAQQ